MKSLCIGMIVFFLAACSSSNYGRITLSDLEVTEIESGVNQVPKISSLETIESYRALLDFPVDNPFRPRAMHRLADLLLDDGERRDIKLADNNETEDIGEYSEAVLIYEELLSSYPDYPEADLVLYQLARVYDKWGDIDRASQLLLRLVNDYQDSRYFSEANFRVAELSFLDGDYRQAEASYSAVLEQGKSLPFYEQSLLKYSWAVFKQDRLDDALKSFFQLIDLKLGQLAFDPISGQALGVGKADQEILTDILRGSTLIFALKDSSQALDQFCQEYGQDNYNHLIYLSLAELYRKEERYLNEAKIYAAYIDQYPESRYAAIFQLRLVDSYMVLNDQQQVVKAKEQFLNNFWLRNKTIQTNFPVEYTAHLSSFATRYLNELSDYYHARFQKAKLAADFNAAVNWYRTYLKYFHLESNAFEKHFLLAELLFDNSRYQEAGDEFEQVAYSYPQHKRGADAAYSAILSYQKQLQISAEDAAGRQHLQQSALRFVSRFPDDPRVPNTLLALADDAFERGDNESALVLVKSLLDSEHVLAAEEAFSAWMFVGHISFQNQDYLQAEQAFQTAHAYLAEQDKKLIESEEWLASAIYKQAEALQAQGELRQAVATLLRIEMVATSSTFVAQAKYDAAAVLIGLEEWQQAADLLETFSTTYPRHILQSEVAVKLAYVYLQSGRIADAARAYERLASRGGDAAIRQEALLQSAKLYQQGGNLGKAASVYKRFIYKYPGVTEQKFNVRIQLAEIYAQLGQINKRDYWLNEIIKNAALVAVKDNDAIQYYAARASLTLAEDRFVEFDSIKLVEPLRETLAKKKNKMESALAAYRKTSDYGFAEFVTAANHRIGEIYFKLSLALIDSSRPAGLDEEEMEQYEMMLEEQAYPFEEQAIKFLESNVARVGEGVYTDWVAKSFASLAMLLPVKYAKQEVFTEVIDVLH